MPQWKAENIKPTCRLAFEGAWPMAVTVCGESRRVVAGNQDGAIVAWTLPETFTPAQVLDEQGKSVDGFAAPPPERRLDGHTNAITHLVATPDGQTLISASLDHTLRFWDMKAATTGEAEVVLDRRQRERAAQKVPTEKRAAVLDAPGVKIGTQQPIATLDAHHDWIQALGISRDGRRLISGDDSGLVIVWDIAQRKEISRWQCLGVAWVVAAALSPDGQTALVSQYRRKGGDFNNYPAGLRVYNVADGAVKLDILATLYPKEKNPPYQYEYQYNKFIAAGLVSAAFSPDGKLLAVGQGGEEGEGKVHLIEVDSGKLVRSVGGHQYGVTEVTFTADGKHVISAGRDTLVRVLNVEDGQEVAKLGKPRGGQFMDWLSAVSVAPSETLLAATDISGFVQIWQVT